MGKYIGHPSDLDEEPEPKRYEDEPIEGVGIGTWLIILLLVIPWVVGAGFLVAEIFDL